ncbi:hypothetical protein [Rhizobium sp. C4]|uniref:hypothetical protein n=1 Tax=Rhizobium sp. C4 TaxID=1349800 RepID=UPI001E4CCECC|nr:hypothetical protein [Rhizobium sp. C4]MCD2171802.1 hypothetical protein [Rhizobium sp. C4]
MKTSVKLVAVALFASLLTQQADASTLRRVVSANKSTSLGFFHVMADRSVGCQQPARPKMLVERAPQHGAVSFKWTHHSGNQVQSGCKGVTVGGWDVVYTPARGYHGPDTFRIGAQYDQYLVGGVSSYSSDGFELVVK